MTNRPDYWNVEIPDPAETTMKEWGCHERRAYLLRKIVDAGDPHMINQTQMAKVFNVNQSSISRDIKRIQQSIVEHLDQDQLVSELIQGYKTLKKKSAQVEDWSSYHKALKFYKELLMEAGIIEKEPEKHEVALSGGISVRDELRQMKKVKEMNLDEEEVEVEASE